MSKREFIVTDPILTVKELSITFPDRKGDLDALASVSFTIQPRELYVCSVLREAEKPRCCASWQD
jgi:ABC-type microcin C transport system duplicated ATPase subunit YejF